jgi:hypothetical protein
MLRRASRSWKTYRTGPCPDRKRWSGRTCWSCGEFSRHEHRWYLSAWLCWRFVQWRQPRL